MEVFELSGALRLEGAGNVKTQLDGIEKKAANVQKGLKVMGAAFTAVGVAGLAMIQSTKGINAELSVTAINLGVTTEEMRNLALEATNVTFPIDEVTKTFDLLARAGVKDQEIMLSVATAFDTLGDATGNAASVVSGIMIDAMKTFGLTAEEAASKGDMMTYMARNSTIGLEDFATMVGYTDQEMVAAGLTIEDMAAAMMYMGDMGIAPGKVMLREWNKAVALSKKEGIAMTEALGMTTEQLDKYKNGLEMSNGTMDEYAAAANEQFTIMDKMKQKWSEVTLGASGFLEPMEPVLAGMTAMGPLMIGLSTSAGTGAIKFALHTTALIANKVAMFASVIAIKAVTAAQWLWNIAMSANPIGLIILGVAALIAIGVLLWKNWDKIMGFFESIPEKIGAAFANLKDIILAPFRAAWQGIGVGINWLIDQLNKIKVDIPSWIPGIGGKSFGIDLPRITLPEFKTGGIFTQPVAGIIGDVPEVVMPLGKLKGMGTTVNIYPQTLIGTKEEIVRYVREALLEIQGSNVNLGWT